MKATHHSGAAANSRVSAFISYAREDQPARQELADALARHDIDVNGDWLLVHGPDYWDQLVQLIEQSDVFVALLSPAFARSDVTRREVDAAASFGKRTLPVVIEDVPDPEALHPALRQPQWAFLRPGDPVDANRAHIVQAMRTDFDDLKLHTDLLLAAERWRAASNQRSLTLRGALLTNAGAWITRANARPAGWSPKPTLLHEEHYRASVVARNRRRSVAAVGGALLLVAAYFAVQEINEQQKQRQTLEDAQASRAEAKAALALLPFKRSEAAARIQKALQLSATDEAVDARRQMTLLRGAVDTTFDLGSLTHVGFLQSGALVARGTGGASGSAVYVRCDGLTDDWRYRASYSLAGTNSAPLAMLASSPDGRTIVAAHGRSVYAWIIDTPERQECEGVTIQGTPPAPATKQHGEDVTAVAVNRAGTLLAFGDTQGTAVVMRLPSFTVVNTIRYQYKNPNDDADGVVGGVSALAFSHDDRRLAVGTTVGPVALWSPEDPQQRPWRITRNRPVNAMTFHPRFDIVAIADEAGVSLLGFSGSIGEVQQRLTVHTGPVRGLAFSDDGKYLVSGSNDTTVLAWNMVRIEDPAYDESTRNNARQILALKGHIQAVSSMASRGEVFASGGEDGRIVLRTFAPLDEIQAAARQTVPAKQTRETTETEKPPGAEAGANEIGVMITIPELDKARSEVARQILRKHSLMTVQGHRPDGGTTYMNTLDYMPQERADEVVAALARAGIKARSKGPSER